MTKQHTVFRIKYHYQNEPDNPQSALRTAKTPEQASRMLRQQVAPAVLIIQKIKVVRDEEMVDVTSFVKERNAS